MGADGYLGQLRQFVGNRLVMVPGVRAMLFDGESRVLLQLRGDLGIWGLPAGAVELDESVFDGLVREVKEETGLTVISARPIGIYTDPKYNFTYPNGDQIKIFELAFFVDKWQGQLHIDGGETLDLQFFPLDRLPDDLYPDHRESIEDYQAFDGEFIVK